MHIQHYSMNSLDRKLLLFSVCPSMEPALTYAAPQTWYEWAFSAFFKTAMRIYAVAEWVI